MQSSLDFLFSSKYNERVTKVVILEVDIMDTQDCYHTEVIT